LGVARSERGKRAKADKRQGDAGQGYEQGD
jgi:hypothetical protein